MTVHKTKIMRDAVRQQLPSGDTVVTKLTAASNGIAADAALNDDATDAIESGSIVTLPQYAFVKFEGSDITNLIQWGDADTGNGTTLLVADDEEVVIRWTIHDSTLDTMRGEVTVQPTTDGHEITGQIPPTRGQHLTQAKTFWTPQERDRMLTRLSQDGARQTFELARTLIPFARTAVRSASVRVYREIHDVPTTGGGAHVIDELEREQVLDNLMWGDGGSGAEGSVVTREIRRLAATDHALRKSVLQLLSTKVWSAAETHVRQYIGDPHLGRVIRRLARDIGTLDPESVLTAYREQNPDARVGMQRITAALTAGATLHTETVSFAELGEAAP